MLPFLISKTKLLPIRKEKKLNENKTKEIHKEKSLFITADKLSTFKPFRLKRRPSKLPTFTACDCNLMHLTKLVINYVPRSRKRGASSNMVLSMTALGTTGQRKRMKLPSVQLPRKSKKKEKPLSYNSDQFFKKLEVLKIYECYF